MLRIKDVAVIPMKREEYETCTKCGGLGRIPNHPHLPGFTCPKCNGTGKILRKDYVTFNQAIAQIGEKEISEKKLEELGFVRKDGLELDTELMIKIIFPMLLEGSDSVAIASILNAKLNEIIVRIK